MAEETVQEKAYEQYRPKEYDIPKGGGSGFKVRDELFTKNKSFLKKNKQPDSIKADWLRVSLSGQEMIFFKGKEITKGMLLYFDDNAKKHFLVKMTKGRKGTEEPEK